MIRPLIYSLIILATLDQAGQAQETHAAGIAPEVIEQHLQAITIAWRKREQRSQTGMVQWTISTRQIGESQPTDPDPTIRYTTKEAYCVGPAGERRYQTQDIPREGLPPRRNSIDCIRTDDGRGDRRELFPPNDVRKGFFGTIPQVWGMRNFIPAAMFFRPTNPQSKLVSRELVVLDTAYDVHGRKCLLVEAPPRRPGNRRQLALDPERDYVITQYDDIDNNMSTTRFRMRYQPHETMGWMLKSWTLEDFGQNRVPSIHRIFLVVDYEVNQEYPEDFFRVTFPPGTRINDELNEFILEVLPDGSRDFRGRFRDPFDEQLQGKPQ